MRWSAALLVLSGCGANEATAVRLFLEWEGEIDVLVIEGRVDDAAAPIRTDEIEVGGSAGSREESLLVLLPDDLDGRELGITARALLRGAIILEGSTAVGVRRGRTVDATIALTALPPAEWYVRAALPSISTSSPIFSEGLAIDFTPASQDEVWLILASGLLASDAASDSAAEMRLVVEGEDRDRFGAVAGGASGFFTYDLVTGRNDPVHVSLELRAGAGLTTASGVRLLAVRLPEGAAAQLARGEAARVPDGGPSERILGMDLSVPIAGRYLIAAGASLRNGGGGTIEAWLREPDGTRLPNAPEGVSFSNSSDALQSFLTLAARSFDQSGGEIVLEGRASGYVTGWWDERYRRRARLVVEASVVAPAGYSVSFPLSRFVARIDPTGRDFRIVFESSSGAIEIDRVLEPGQAFTSSTARVWFATQEMIDQGEADDRYVVYYDAADPNALEPPPDAPANVFELFDSFDGSELDGGLWTIGGNGSVSVANGEATLRMGASIFSAQSRFPAHHRYEARLRLSTPVGAFYDYLSASAMNDFTQDHLVFWSEATGHFVGGGVAGDPMRFPWSPADPTHFHVYGLSRLESRVPFDQDGVVAATLEGVLPTSDLAVFARNTTPDGLIVFDWIRVRQIRDPEPVAALLDEEVFGWLGEWGHPRALALRIDAFESTAVNEQRSAQTVESGYRALHRLAIGGAGTPRRYLVIQSLRVSGDASAGARRSGEIRVAGEVVASSSVRTLGGRAAAGGHHHILAFADVVTADRPIDLENGIASPDGIVVEGADSVIIALGRSD